MLEVALAFGSGLLIGCIGIGGVLLVPSLSLAGIEVHKAIGASLLSFICSGLIGVWLYAREGSIRRASAGWLGVGAMPGALAGSFVASRLSGELLLALVGVAVIFASVRSLLGQSAREGDGRSPSPAVLILIGAVVGVASAVTGTGGALLLVPLLLWLEIPVLEAVGLGQAIQIPIAALASVGNFWIGQLDLRLGALLSIGVAIGTAVGARVAHAMPRLLLSRLVAVVLLLVGALLLFRSGHALAVAE